MECMGLQLMVRSGGEAMLPVSYGGWFETLDSCCASIEPAETTAQNRLYSHLGEMLNFNLAPVGSLR